MSFSGWTSENVALATDLYLNKGYSASKVAHAIGHPSRSAVIGKLRRLGVQREGASIPSVREPYPGTRKPAPGRFQSETVRHTPRAVKVSTPPRRPESVVEDVTNARHWTERKFGECCWPVSGEGADVFSCCAPVYKRGWCAHHFGRGVVASTKKAANYYDPSIQHVRSRVRA